MSDVVEVVTETFVVDVAGDAGRGFTSRGAWAAGASYAPYDVVTDGGQTFENTVATAGSTPPAADGAHWRLWAAKGADGASGNDALLKAQNLADLPSAATARANLGLGTAATHPATDFDASGAAGAALASALAASQPLDADLTAIAALTTSSFGRSFLALADAAAARTLLALGTAATAAASDFDAAGTASAAQAASQPLDSDLTAIAALTTTAYGRSLLALADAAAGRTALVLGTAATSATVDFDAAGAASAAQAASQPLDSDLTAIAALSTTAYGRAFLVLADAAAGRTALGLGTAATSASTAFDAAGAAAAAQGASQPLDSDLTAIAALDSATAGALVTDGAGWIRKTYAQLKTALGLGNVDNTSDANKPVSTAQQTALDAKANDAAVVHNTGPTADLPFNGHKATGLADPTSAQDAVTKAYVDAFNQGFDLKASVRAASNTNHALSAPGATVDGVTMAAGDRVLLRAQTAAAENGIYVWNGASSTMTRTTDADTSAKVTSGLYTFATEGTAWGSTGFGLITADPITLGTTALTFSPVSGVGEVIAGTGLSKTGNTLAVSDAELLALAGLTSAADKQPYFTGSGTAALTTQTAFARTLGAAADAATALATLGAATFVPAARAKISGGAVQYGIPDAHGMLAPSTSACASGVLRYSPMLVRTARTINVVAFEVTTGPASNAHVRSGIYAADGDWQPTGAPLFDVEVAVASGATGVFTGAVANVPLPPGRYLIVNNCDVTMTLRSYNMGIQAGVQVAMGSSAINRFTVASAYAALASPTPVAWTTLATGVQGTQHNILLGEV